LGGGSEGQGESTFAETEVRSEMREGREREREEKLEKLERWVARWARPTGTTWVESDKVEGIAGLIYAQLVQGE
jgi:hypothetical protein